MLEVSLLVLLGDMFEAELVIVLPMVLVVLDGLVLELLVGVLDVLALLAEVLDID